MKHIAIIGAGISGLGAAYLLHNDYKITLYEKNAVAGGHARTLEVDYDGVTIPVDTGFIVFNYRNYPNLTGLFGALDVPVEESDMSLGLSIGNGKFEWGCAGLNAVFAQRSNFISPRFWGMIRDIMRFNKQALELAKHDRTMTLGELLDQLGLGNDFRNRFLLPTAGAIWSSSPGQILDFPAYSFVTFFDNHGLLTVNDQPQWHTVSGGSREYVSRLCNALNADIKLNTPVATITRHTQHVTIRTETGDEADYDGVIIAAHSDQALRMLADPSVDERDILTPMRYQNNRAYLHRDSSFMPNRTACWSSWNYLCDSEEDERARITVTYWMNRLQNIDRDKPLFVTLNPPVAPDPELTFDEHMFEHPVYDMDMLDSQQQLQRIQGKQRTWFCGAWQRFGFHEDGLSSAVNVCKQLGCMPPW